jgi:hypothetical protein
VCYLLGSIDELQRFQLAPDRFVPALHGYDPVTYQTEHRLTSGAVELGVRFRNRIYFFANEANRDLFLSVPRQFSETTELTFIIGRYADRCRTVIRLQRGSISAGPYLFQRPFDSQLTITDFRPTVEGSPIVAEFTTPCIFP